MRATIASVALALVAVAAAGAGCHAAAADDFASHVTVQAATTAKGKLEVTLTPKDGWMVNSAYPALKLKVTAAPGLKLGKTDLGHAEAAYQGKESEDHAAKVVFTTSATGKATGAVTGTYKLVICSKDTCSPPFHGSFSVTPKAPGA